MTYCGTNLFPRIGLIDISRITAYDIMGNNSFIVAVPHDINGYPLVYICHFASP